VSGDFPSIGRYRGVEIHSFQTIERIEQVVKREIDLVLGTDDPDALWTILRDNARSPEARLAAEAKLLAPAAAAEASRRKSPIDAARVKAAAAGLDALRRADPLRYTSILHPSAPDDPPVPPRPPEHAEALRVAQEAAR